jgi:hypothetical protein
MPTVTSILGGEECAYFCHSSTGESLTILPILYLGI